MEQAVAYHSKVTRLKNMMNQTTIQVEKMRRRADEVKKVKGQNNEKLKEKWKEEKDRDRELTAKMVDNGEESPGEVSTETAEMVGGPVGSADKGKAPERIG